MSIYEQHSAAISEVIAAAGSPTASINGEDWLVLPGSKTRGGTLDVGGIAVTFDFSVTLPYSTDAARLRKGFSVYYDGDTFRIDSVVIGAGNSHVRLLCVTPTRGA